MLVIEQHNTRLIQCSLFSVSQKRHFLCARCIRNTLLAYLRHCHLYALCRSNNWETPRKKLNML